MAPSEKPTVGRRVSNFFGRSGSGADNSPPDTTRPVSRGRQQDPAKLRKSSLPWVSSQNSSQQNLSPRALPTTSAHHSNQPSLDGFALPNAPFARQASSAPGSRSASPATRSRNASPGPALLHPHQQTSRTSLTPATPLAPQGKPPRKRMSWMPGSKNNNPKPESRPSTAHQPDAWIVGRPHDKPAYDLTPLITGQPLDELWDASGDLLVYLFPESGENGPSIRTHSFALAASDMLTDFRLNPLNIRKQDPSLRYYSTTNGPACDSDHNEEPHMHGLTPHASSSNDFARATKQRKRLTQIAEDAGDSELPVQKLRIPIQTTGAFSSASHYSGNIGQEDVRALLDIRNMIAFLTGQALVADPLRPGVHDVFSRIADILKAYGFGNQDDSTFGEVAAESFELYVSELGLRDVRSSRESTIDALLLAEKMRSESLYREAFVHAAGKFADIKELLEKDESVAAKYSLISETTRKRVELAAIELQRLMESVTGRLGDFDFPQMFSGVMNSRTADERKNVRFDAWRSNFMATRKAVLSYYKELYGSWPPKASAKKNNLTRSGLSRTVLWQLYQDFSALYDLLVDRQTLTSRTNNAYVPDEDGAAAGDAPFSLAMWRVLDEYDRSTPPVQPVPPFDIPILPQFSGSFATTGDAKKDAKLRTKKLKNDEIKRILAASHNSDTGNAKGKTPSFLQYMMEFEHKRAQDSSLQELTDQRGGLWMFLYAVHQSLPALVIDAPGLQFTQGVEYLLCALPRDHVPWATHKERAWYSVGGGGGVVALPSNAVEFSREAVYRRSHMWVRGQEWSGALGIELPDATDPATEGMPPPDQSTSVSGVDLYDPPRRPSAGLSVPGSPNLLPAGSRSASKDRRASALSLGLESLPIPHGVGVTPFGAAAGSPGLHPGGLHLPRSRPGTREGSRAPAASAAPAPEGKSFDDILADMDAEAAKAAKDKKKKK